VQAMLLFYNNALFEEAGLDPTVDFATWDEFREAAVALTKRDGDNLTQVGVDITSSPYQWYYSAPTLAFADGQVNDETGLVNDASDPGYDVWTKLTDLVTVDGVESPDFLADQSKFGAGLAAMTLREFTFSGVYALSAPDVDFSVHIPPPVSDETYGGVATTSWAYVVSADCADQDAAWAWISYLTSEDAGRIWTTEGGELPARQALLDDPTLAADDPDLAVGIAALADAMAYDSRGWDDVWGIQQGIWDEIVLNGTDVETAVDQGAEAERELYRSKGLLE
jgi:multiple sugar transport system substrate-binding protein